MLTHPTLDQMHRLGLAGMATAYRELTEQIHANDLSFDERLGLMLDREIALRADKRLTNRLATAKLRFANASIEDIDFTAHRGLDRRNVLSLAQGAWLKANENLILTGQTGTGKTWIACAFGRQAARLDYSVLYVRMPRLFEALALARGDGRYGRLLKTLGRVQLLILDDWGLSVLTAASAATSWRSSTIAMVAHRQSSRAKSPWNSGTTLSGNQTSTAATIVDGVVSYLTVVDPRHGLAGQRLELLSRYSARGPAFVVVRLPNGRRRSIRRSVTDLTAPSPEEQGASKSLARINVRTLLTLMHHLNSTFTSRIEEVIRDEHPVDLHRVASQTLTGLPNPGMTILPNLWLNLPKETQKQIAQSLAPLLIRMRPTRAPLEADRHVESVE